MKIRFLFDVKLNAFGHHPAYPGGPLGLIPRCIDRKDLEYNPNSNPDLSLIFSGTIKTLVLCMLCFI